MESGEDVGNVSSVVEFRVACRQYLAALWTVPIWRGAPLAISRSYRPDYSESRRWAQMMASGVPMSLHSVTGNEAECRIILMHYPLLYAMA